MENSNIQLQLLQLTEIQNICNQIIKLESVEQNDEALLKLLKKEYKLSKAEIASIQSVVLGKKKGEGVDEKELADLKQKCESYCLICDVKMTNRKGDIIGYDKLKSKCSNKKSILSKKLEVVENTEKKSKKK
jgi:hypothetical protein